jgi:predicted ribosome quality control (RQC) complex YloA/Tae2 family protein
MALDGMTVRALVHELSALTGGRIHKIHQPNPHDLIWQIRAEGRTMKLLLSASPTYPRVHLTERTFPNPLDPPMFCMLLRKHCENGMIENIRQVGMQRIIHIDVRQRDELGDDRLKRLIVELTGRHSNVILVDPHTGTILDGIRHVTPAISQHRIVMPGAVYTEPPDQGKRNPLELKEGELGELIRSVAQQPGLLEHPERWLVDTFDGISPQAAREIVHRARTMSAPGQPGGVTAEALRKAMETVLSLLAGHRYEPVIVEPRPDGKPGKSIFSVIPLTHAEGEVRRFDSVSACLETYYGDKAEKDLVKQKVGDLFRFLQNEIARNVRKLDKLRTELAEAEEAEKFRVFGELLTAHLHMLKKGDSNAQVPNYYEESQPVVDIPLDPQLTPAENAQRYFRKYSKLKTGKAAIREQMQAAETEIRYLDTLLAQLENAGLRDVEEIREELEEGGYLKSRGQKERKKQKRDRRPALTRYLSSEQIEIYVGKNNIQNEYITNRLAKPDDTWLHVKDLPGSHVVIRAREFGEATLKEAAMLAVHFSKARESSQVPVDYTLIRHVRKPNGAKPGFVIYERQKTLFVTPDPAVIANLKPVTT